MHQLGLKEVERTGKNERRLWMYAILQEKGRRTVEKIKTPRGSLPGFQQGRCPPMEAMGQGHWTPGDMTPSWQRKQVMEVMLPTHCVQKAEHLAKEGWSGTLRSQEFVLLGFGLSWDLSPLPSFLVLSPGMGMSGPCLSHHSILEAYCLVGFTVSQLKRNLFGDECTWSLIHIWLRWSWGEML